MTKISQLETQMKVVLELSAAVKDLLASEHNEAAGLLVTRLLSHVENAEKLLQEHKTELVPTLTATPVLDTIA
jgi:hypothetical protein